MLELGLGTQPADTPVSGTPYTISVKKKEQWKPGQRSSDIADLLALLYNYLPYD